MGMGTSVSTAVSERTAVIIEDYMFDATVAGELTPEESPSDFHDTWDLDGTDFTPEVSPDDEGYWDDFENVVLNGNYEELGSELVANGTFSADTNWTFAGTNASISNGVGVFPDATSSFIIQSNVVPASVKTYKLVYEVTKTNEGNLFLAGGSNAFGTVSLTNTVGTHTKFITSNGSQRNLQFANQTGFVGEIDNISLKQVDPNDRWSLGTSWSIEDGKLKNDGTNTGFQSAQQNNVTVVGDTYEVTVTVEATSGAVELKGSGMYTRIDTLGVGTHTFNIVADATYIRFLAHASATITLDNFTVREYAIRPLDV